MEDCPMKGRHHIWPMLAELHGGVDIEAQFINKDLNGFDFVVSGGHM